MIQSKNPAFRDYVLYKIGLNRFMHHLGFRVETIEQGLIEGRLIMQEMHLQQNGFAHGGVISTLCDLTAGLAAYSLVEEGQQVFTAEIKVSYFSPGKGTELFSKGWVIKSGQRLHFCESEVYAISGSNSRLIAKASATMAIV